MYGREFFEWREKHNEFHALEAQKWKRSAELNMAVAENFMVLAQEDEQFAQRHEKLLIEEGPRGR